MPVKDYKNQVAELSPREREVVRLLTLGCTCVEVGKILDIASSTVDNHKSRAMDKLGVHKLALLTRVAIKHRLTSVGEQLTAAEKRKRGRKLDGWN
ncbi:MAG: response regulator transcription factor [Planctomycetales bacterium]|nr:response regulator transcription factor [Planctomycetales bacterium]